MNTTPVVMHKAQMEKYQKLEFSKPVATYVWIDRSGTKLQSRDITLDNLPKTHEELPPKYFFDCSPTARDYCDVHLKTEKIYPNPFYKNNSVLFLSSTYNKTNPTPTNHRESCENICTWFEKSLDPWFGFNQDFVLMSTWNRPLGWPRVGFPKAPGSLYCAIGSDKIVNRDFMHAFQRCCLYAEIKLYGINTGRTPSFWNFQVGPSPGIKAADDLWMARYILARLAEEYGIFISYEPHPVAACPENRLFTYFSTKNTRAKHGLSELERIISQFELEHIQHVIDYNKHKDDDEPIPFEKIGEFTSGIGDRNVSVRIPRKVEQDESGYLEDRRAPSNADPYRIITRILKTFE